MYIFFSEKWGKTAFCLSAIAARFRWKLHQSTYELTSYFFYLFYINTRFTPVCSVPLPPRPTAPRQTVWRWCELCPSSARNSLTRSVKVPCCFLQSTLCGSKYHIKFHIFIPIYYISKESKVFVNVLFKTHEVSRYFLK